MLGDLDDTTLDRLAAAGFDWLYLLGVWQTGAAGRRVARTRADLRPGYEAALDDLREDDICGSCFAVTGYRVRDDLGGEAALADLRARLGARGMRLMVDFVPNHTAIDHPWATAEPDRYVPGTEAQLAATPDDYTRLPDGRIVAHGRDPYFPGWTDTLQLDYSNPDTRAAMTGELLSVTERADGVRCDMAMLLLADVFERTWGRPIAAFWPEAIRAVRDRHPACEFMAEVYWDREWDLQQQGFDHTYDKRLYDRLVAGDPATVRQHLRADADFQRRSARFLENHDEPRAASVFAPDRLRAAAAITFLCPGLRFIHDGQLEGFRRFVPMQLCRGPDETVDTGLATFHDALLACLRYPVVRDGRWQLLDAIPAWEGNPTADEFVVYAWDGDGGDRLVVAVNYADHRSQCRLRLPFPDLTGHTVTLVDQLGTERYERDGAELTSGPGLYLDLPAWGHNAFTVTRDDRTDTPSP